MSGGDVAEMLILIGGYALLLWWLWMIVIASGTLT